jgi:phosphohistidine phosphatase
MLTLTLFRHAKSSWGHPALEDFDRPLNERGERDAPRTAAFLAEQAYVPDLILCSSAKRTRQTLDLTLPAWKPRPKVDYSDALYHATAPAMLAMLRDAPAEAKHVMIIGHNPGLESFATRLIGEGDKNDRLVIATKFPTAAAAVITFEAKSWADVEPGSGYLALFATPKQLS